MTSIKLFEDLIAWQKARILVVEIYKICCEGKLSRDFGLRDQIQRAAVSVMSNIAEGFEKGGLHEFHRFLFTAKASCAELRSQLYIAHDVGYLDESGFQMLISKAVELSRIIGGLRKAVERKKKEN